MAHNAVPRIAVILPVYNGALYLRACIESVLTQSEADFELLIGDDVSTDDSLKIISEFQDPRIRFVQRPKNLGLFRNLNLLVEMSRAPLLHFLGQDDQLVPHCLAEELKFFANHQEIAMSFCKYINIDAQNHVIAHGALNDMNDVLSSRFAAQMFFYYGCIPGNISTVCVRRDSIVSLNCFDLSYGVASDYDMWVRLCKEQPLGVIHQHLIHLRDHSGQLSRAKRSGLENMIATHRIRENLFPALPLEIKDSARKFSLWTQDIQNMHYAIRKLLSGDLEGIRILSRIYGWIHVPLILGRWLITVNNHLYKPSPIFVED